MSADGSRVLIAAIGAPGIVRIRDRGVWGETRPLFRSFSGLAAGFTPAGKAWILQGLVVGIGPNGGDHVYVLFEEP
jgi:hypothetical protein